MISDEQIAELEAAEAVIESWEDICQEKVRVAREADESYELVNSLQEDLYAAARDRKGLPRLSIEDIRAAKERYGLMVTEYRAVVTGDLSFLYAGKD